MNNFSIGSLPSYPDIRISKKQNYTNNCTTNFRNYTIKLSGNFATLS